VRGLTPPPVLLFPIQEDEEDVAEPATLVAAPAPAGPIPGKFHLVVGLHLLNFIKANGSSVPSFLVDRYASTFKAP
jgi:hypothetical protein